MAEIRHTLVFGGARSGKSAYAERLAPAAGGLHYLATAQAQDDEMRARIAQHRAGRDARWTTHEVPLDLIETLQTLSQPGRFILIDCITLWLANLLIAERDCDTQIRNLLRVIQSSPARIVIVSNEVGLGIVPDNALSRVFRDEQGRANQRLAAVCDDVYLIAAGLPLKLKPQ